MLMFKRFLYCAVTLLCTKRTVASLTESLVLTESAMTRLLVVKAMLGKQEVLVALNFTEAVSYVFLDEARLAFVDGYNPGISDTLSAEPPPALAAEQADGSIDWLDATDTLKLGSKCTFPAFQFRLVTHLSPDAEMANDVAGVLGVSFDSEIGENSLMVFEATELGYQLRVVPGRYLSEEFEPELTHTSNPPEFFATKVQMYMPRQHLRPASKRGWILRIPFLQPFPTSDGKDIISSFDTFIDFTQEGILVHQSILPKFIETVIGEKMARKVDQEDGFLWVQCDETSGAQNYIRFEIGDFQGIPVPLVRPVHEAAPPKSLGFKNRKTHEIIVRQMCQTVIRVSRNPDHTNLVVMGRMLLRMTDVIAFSGRESQMFFKFPRSTVYPKNPSARRVGSIIDRTTVAGRIKGPPNDWLMVEPYVPTYDTPVKILGKMTDGPDPKEYTEVKFMKNFQDTGEWILMSPDFVTDPLTGSVKISFRRNPRKDPSRFREFHPFESNEPTGEVTVWMEHYCWESKKLVTKFGSLTISLVKADAQQSCSLSTLEMRIIGKRLHLTITPIGTLSLIENPQVVLTPVDIVRPVARQSTPEGYSLENIAQDGAQSKTTTSVGGSGVFSKEGEQRKRMRSESFVEPASPQKIHK